MLGRVRRSGDTLRFEPRFPLRPGTPYHATFRPDALPGSDPSAVTVEAVFELPESESGTPTRVVAVYPSADELPENLLRFYIHFSNPMSRGEAYRRIRLLDESGRPVVAAFLELDEELWDPSGTRLTLLIDPGRIKSGLVPREEMGPVLMNGRRYVLAIDGDWIDARGRPLDDSYRKPFRAGPSDDQPPEPESWRVSPPSAGGREPLVVSFPEPLDRALLVRLLRVVDASGTTVRGRSEIGDRESRWSFVPEPVWKPGDYRLVVDTDLEDPAGNGVGRPFEVDVFDRIEPKVEVRSVAVPFRVE